MSVLCQPSSSSSSYGIECTPLCNLRLLPNQPNHYQCPVHRSIHACTRTECTYQYQLDRNPIDDPMTCFYCPVSKQKLYDHHSHEEEEKEEKEEEEEEKDDIDLISSFLGRSTSVLPIKNKNKRTTPSSSSFSDKVKDREKKDQLSKLLPQIPLMVESILTRCKIFHLLPKDDLYNINLMCQNTFQRIICSPVYDNPKHQLARKNYTIFYHVLMMLYNMKKKSGCIMPISSDYLNETVCKKVVLHLPFMEDHLPNENQIKKLLAHTTIVQTTTTSHRRATSEPQTNHYSYDQSIHNNLFTSARQFFCMCLSSDVRANPKSWPFTITTDQI